LRRMQTIRSGGPISSGLAGMWMSLAEPVKTELRGAYELPPRKAA